MEEENTQPNAVKITIFQEQKALLEKQKQQLEEQQRRLELQLQAKLPFDPQVGTNQISKSEF